MTRKNCKRHSAGPDCLRAAHVNSRQLTGKGLGNQRLDALRRSRRCAQRQATERTWKTVDSLWSESVRGCPHPPRSAAVSAATHRPTTLNPQPVTTVRQSERGPALRGRVNVKIPANSLPSQVEDSRPGEAVFSRGLV